MATRRILLEIIAPAALAILLCVGSASADTIISSSVSAFGNIPTFSAPGDQAVSAAQFNEAAVNASIQTACPAGFFCSALTLTEIDFTLQANLAATVNILDARPGVTYIGPITSEGGTFGHPTSGFAVAEVATVSLIDPFLNDVVDVSPTFSIPTTKEFRGSGAGTGACSGALAPTATKFVNCLAVPVGVHIFSGTGTDTETGSYLSTDFTPTLLAGYVGTGTVAFDLALDGLTENGTIQSGVTIPANTATIQALVDGLTVTYDYTYSLSTTPEPGTMALLGGAFLGLGLLRKRLRKS